MVRSSKLSVDEHNDSSEDENSSQEYDFEEWVRMPTARYYEN